ncbi:MAG: hypothetical protein SGPRY_014604, partial [Prymnesium sp.]
VTWWLTLLLTLLLVLLPRLIGHSVDVYGLSHLLTSFTFLALTNKCLPRGGPLAAPRKQATAKLIATQSTVEAQLEMDAEPMQDSPDQLMPKVLGMRSLSRVKARMNACSRRNTGFSFSNNDLSSSIVLSRAATGKTFSMTSI